MRIESIFIAIAVGSLLCGIVRAGEVGPSLSAVDIERMLIGHKEWFIASDGRTRGGIYNQDGSYLYGDGSGGNWRIDGNNFCEKAGPFIDWMPIHINSSAQTDPRVSS
jgi:hypothetical protein